MEKYIKAREGVETIPLGLIGSSHRYKTERGEISLVHPCRTTMDTFEIYEISENGLFEDVERFDTLEEAENRIKELLEYGGKTMENIEPLVKEIISLERQAEAIEAEMQNNGSRERGAIVEKFRIQMIDAQADYDKFVEPYIERIKPRTKDMQDKRNEIAVIMSLTAKKTVELDIAKVEMRTTKSVKILNKVGLVTALMKIDGGIEEGVKSFALKHIGGLVKAKALNKDLVGFEETKRVYINVRGEGTDSLVGSVRYDVKESEGPCSLNEER